MDLICRVGSKLLVSYWIYCNLIAVKQNHEMLTLVVKVIINAKYSCFFMPSKNVLLVIVTSGHHFRSDLYLLELIGTCIYD